MFLLGVAAFFQVTFLPGFLFLKLSKKRFSHLQTLIFSFALSLIINYLLVLMLTTFSFYTHPTMLSIFCLEILLLIFIQRKNLFLLLNKRLSVVLTQTFNETGKKVSDFIFGSSYNLLGKSSWAFNFIAFVGALISVYWVTTFFIGNLGSFSIFSWHDVIVSWNKWAEDWFNNQYPYGIMQYPQIIPANWSVFYIFIGAPIQYFPKIIMPLFPLSLLLLMFDLGLRKKSVGYFLGIIATTLFLKNAFGGMIPSGLVDIPIAFMSFLSIYCLLVCQESNTKVTVKKYLFYGIIFAATSSLIKQPGLYVFMIYPLLAYFLVFKKRKYFFYKKDLWHFSVLYLICLFILIVPFYLYASIYEGSSANAVLYQAALHGGQSLFSRLIYSIKIFLSYNLFFLNIIHNYYLHFILGIIAGLFYGTLVLFCLLDRSFKYIVIFLLVPYYLIWSFFICYDFRNFSIAVPIYGLCLGMGFELLLGLKKDNYPGKLFYIIFTQIKSIKGYSFVLSILVLFILINFKYPSNYLFFKQQELALKKDNEKLNKLLLKYKNLITSDKILLTDYLFNRVEPLRTIPHWYKRSHMGNEEIARNIDKKNERLNEYFKTIENPKVGYLLISDNAFEGIKDTVKNKIKNGKYRLIFHEANHMFLEKV